MDGILEAITDLFKKLLDFVYSLLFGDSSLIADLGGKMFNLFSHTYKDGSFIFIICGIGILAYLIRIIVNIARG